MNAQEEREEGRVYETEPVDRWIVELNMKVKKVGMFKEGSHFLNRMEIDGNLMVVRSLPNHYGTKLEAIEAGASVKRQCIVHLEEELKKTKHELELLTIQRD